MEKSKKSKLNIILLSVLGVLIVAIIVVAVMLHNVNKKNEAAFNADLHEYCIEKNINISRDGTEFTVNISSQQWDDLEKGLQTLFCELVYAKISQSIWDHHIYNENTMPIVYYYVDGERVAKGVLGKVEKE